MSKLAVAVSVAKNRKEKQKNASTESRPMPETKVNDASMVARNEAKKALTDSKATDRPDKEQTKERKKGLQPIAQPSMPKGATFGVRRSDNLAQLLKEDEMRQMQAFAPGEPKAQPKAMYDEAVKPGNGPVPPAQKHFAEGGEVTAEEEEIEHAASIAGAIMARRKFAKGGMVSDDMADLEEHSEESGNVADELNMDALGKEQYDLDQVDAQPEDSNEIEPEHDAIDTLGSSKISAIRKRMRAKSAITK